VTRRSRIIWAAAVLCVAGALAGSWWWERQGVAYLFDLKQIPWSVSSVDCQGFGMTSDTLYTCSFSVDPKDFPKLLVSERYELDKTNYYKRAHDLGMSANLGPNFPVGFHYQALPKDALHGGSIDVLTDDKKELVIAHLYIE
jgi:hypothetical protein